MKKKRCKNYLIFTLCLIILFVDVLSIINKGRFTRILFVVREKYAKYLYIGYLFVATALQDNESELLITQIQQIDRRSGYAQLMSESN